MRHAFSVKYSPITDMHLQGERAARMLVRAIREVQNQRIDDQDSDHRSDSTKWTGASPWSDLIQRALTWEAARARRLRERLFRLPLVRRAGRWNGHSGIYNGDPSLADRVANDMANWVWRKRDALLNTVKVYSMKDGVSWRGKAVASAARRSFWPTTAIVLLPTWLLREIIDKAFHVPDRHVASRKYARRCCRRREIGRRVRHGIEGRSTILLENQLA